jgi:uncharacterized protein
VQGLRPPPPAGRDRDPAGRPRSARERDSLGRPRERSTAAGARPDPAALPAAEALTQGQHLLDTGRPFAAHEVFEAVWKAAPGSERELWRGLAQLAVGITHAGRGNDRGAQSLLERAADTLAGFAASTPYGIDVDGIRDWAQRAARRPALCARPPRLSVRPASPTGSGSQRPGTSPLGE